jgi:hypothetical protein
MHTPHIINFDMDFGLFIISNLITYMFPIIPVERLVGGSLRCSQDDQERVKLTTLRGLYSWAGQSRPPLSRGGGNQKMGQNLNKLVWDVPYNIKLILVF